MWEQLLCLLREAWHVAILLTTWCLEGITELIRYLRQRAQGQARHEPLCERTPLALVDTMAVVAPIVGEFLLVRRNNEWDEILVLDLFDRV